LPSACRATSRPKDVRSGNVVVTILSDSKGRGSRRGAKGTGGAVRPGRRDGPGRWPRPANHPAGAGLYWTGGDETIYLQVGSFCRRDRPPVRSLKSEYARNRAGATAIRGSSAGRCRQMSR
jgi:hypothetical protein